MNLSTEELFTQRPPKKIAVNNMVIIKFTVPLVQGEILDVKAIIAVPEQEADLAVLSGNGERVQIVALNLDQSKYFYINQADQVAEGVYENVSWLTTSKCMLQILSMSDNVNDCVKKSFPIEKTEIFALKPDYAVVFKESSDNVSIRCSDIDEKILGGSIRL